MGTAKSIAGRTASLIGVFFFAAFAAICSASIGVLAECADEARAYAPADPKTQETPPPTQDGDGIPASETRSGTVVGKARILANGDIAFKISPAAGVFRQKGAAYEVVVAKDAAISFFKDAGAIVGRKLSVLEATAQLNKTPTLISISGNFNSNTNTFHAKVALEIVA